MKGRRAGRRCARDTLASLLVHPLPALSPVTPFFPLFSPWATWSRTSRHGNPRQSRWKLNRGTLSVSHPFYPALSDVAFRSPSLFLFANVPKRIRVPLSPSFPNYLSPHRAPFLPSGGLSVLFLRSAPLRNPLSPLPSRTLASPVARSR